MSSTTQTRPNKVATVIIPVVDQKAAVDFYTNKLGFVVTTDTPFGPEEDAMHWIEVGVNETATTIALAPPPPDYAVTVRETGISIQVDDIDAYHAQLKDAGVDVDEAVQRMGDPVPPMFWFRDHAGNSLMVVQ
ncbi:MAG TPA: VOC family protein [Mycobacteriales bacterium]|nr:VOC family protein [Mycobacteriales bacterium]